MSAAHLGRERGMARVRDRVKVSARKRVIGWGKMRVRLEERERVRIKMRIS